MFAYLGTYFSFALLTFLGKRRELNDSGYFNNRISILWFYIFIYLNLLIGLRLEVGGDWDNYLMAFNQIKELSLIEIFNTQNAFLSDPLYLLISWISASLGLGVYGINFICGFIFSIGLISLCRSFQRPLLALTIAFPYLIVVVAMGYTRQSAALGLAMLGLAGLIKAKNLKFIILIFLAAMLHKSAIILIPIIGFAVSKSRVLISFFGILFFILAYYLFLNDAIERVMYAYIESNYQSEGALIRLAMNAVPALIFLFLRRRFRINHYHDHEINLWTIFSFVSLFMFVIYPIFPSSVILDRIALYLLPIQLFVFSNLPFVLTERSSVQNLFTFLVVAWYLLVLLVWLFFANNRFWWVPYRSLITELFTI